MHSHWHSSSTRRKKESDSVTQPEGARGLAGSEGSSKPGLRSRENQSEEDKDSEGGSAGCTGKVQERRQRGLGGFRFKFKSAVCQCQ